MLYCLKVRDFNEDISFPNDASLTYLHTNFKIMMDSLLKEGIKSCNFFLRTNYRKEDLKIRFCFGRNLILDWENSISFPFPRPNRKYDTIIL